MATGNKALAPDGITCYVKNSDGSISLWKNGKFVKKYSKGSSQAKNIINNWKKYGNYTRKNLDTRAKERNKTNSLNLKTSSSSSNSLISETTDTTESSLSSENVSEESIETSEDEEDVSFYLHLGKILKTYNYYNNFNASYEDDYSGFKGSGKVKFKLIGKEELKNIYKGVRCLLKFGRYYSYEKEITVKPVLLSFITDISFTREGTELTLEDEGRLLEEKDELTYNQMLRSEIFKEVIRTAGLTPEVDFTGLCDDVIDWTSVTSSGGNGDISQSDSFNECSPCVDMCNKLGTKVSKKGDIPSNITPNMYASIGKSDAPYASAVKGKNAKEVWQACKDGLVYTGYSCNRDKCASQSWNGKHLNCGDSSRLLKCCMDIAGIPCIIIHAPGHFYNAVKVGSNWITADLCYVNNRYDTNQLMA